MSDRDRGPDDSGDPDGPDRDPGEGDGARDDDADPDLATLLADLEGHLAATEELPVDPAAGRWIGEAQAVAADLTRGDPPSRAVVARRVGHVRDLLAAMGDPGNDRTRERVAAARSVADRIQARIDGDGSGDGGVGERGADH